MKITKKNLTKATYWIASLGSFSMGLHVLYLLWGVDTIASIAAFLSLLIFAVGFIEKSKEVK